MRSGRHLVVSSASAAALVGLLAAASASAANAPGTVAFRVSFTGSGQLWVTGALKSGRYICTSTSSPCAPTFPVPRGRRIVLHEQPANGWHLTGGWRAACYGSHSVMRSQVGSEQSCGLRLKARRTVQLTFVPPYPGSFLNPWPLGTTIMLGSSSPTFDVTVNSATINADAEVEAVTDPSTGKPVNGPPPTGGQYTLVNISLTYMGFPGSSATLPYFLDQVAVQGAGTYKPDTCVPPPLDLGSLGTVPSGQTETGYLCFTIASTDASYLVLRAPDTGPRGEQFSVWFALR